MTLQLIRNVLFTITPYYLINIVFLLGYIFYLYVIGLAYSNSLLYCFMLCNTAAMLSEAYIYLKDNYGHWESFFLVFQRATCDFILSLISILLVHLSKHHVKTEASLFVNVISFFLSALIPILLTLSILTISVKRGLSGQPNVKFYDKEITMLCLLIIHLLIFLYPGLSYYFFYSYYSDLALWPLLLAIPTFIFTYAWSYESCRESLSFNMKQFICFFYRFFFVTNIYQIFVLISPLLNSGKDAIFNK